MALLEVSAKHLKRTSYQFLSTAPQKQKGRKHFQTHFMRPAFLWRQSQTRTVRGEKVTGQYPWCKILHKVSANLIQQCAVKDNAPWSSGIYLRDSRVAQHPQISTCDRPHNKFKKSVWQNSTSTYERNSTNRIEGMHLNITKATRNKPAAHFVSNAERLNTFPLRSGTRRGRPLPPLLFNMVLETLARESRPEKERKGIWIGKKRNKRPVRYHVDIDHYKLKTLKTSWNNC